MPSVTSADNGKILKVINNEWSATTPNIVYGGTSTPMPSLGNNGDIYLQSSPTVIYETDGTTGLLGLNESTLSNTWQLTDLDLSSYSYLKCYFKGANITIESNSNYSPAMVIILPLDSAAMSQNVYMAGQSSILPFNNNRHYNIVVAVDNTKTKFKIVSQTVLWDITSSDANNNGRYLYKIEGYI